jgi:hypothetical protein
VQYRQKNIEDDERQRDAPNRDRLYECDRCMCRRLTDMSRKRGFFTQDRCIVRLLRLGSYGRLQRQIQDEAKM